MKRYARFGRGAYRLLVGGLVFALGVGVAYCGIFLTLHLAPQLPVLQRVFTYAVALIITLSGAAVGATGGLVWLDFIEALLSKLKGVR